MDMGSPKSDFHIGWPDDNLVSVIKLRGQLFQLLWGLSGLVHFNSICLRKGESQGGMNSGFRCQVSGKTGRKIKGFRN